MKLSVNQEPQAIFGRLPHGREKVLDLISLMFAFSGKLSSPNDVTVLLKLLLTYWTRVPWLPDLSVGQIQVEQCPPCGAVLTPTAMRGFSSTSFLTSLVTTSWASWLFRVSQMNMFSKPLSGFLGMELGSLVGAVRPWEPLSEQCS